MSYQDNVRAAAAALQRGEETQRTADQFKWELARLTYESTREPLPGRPYPTSARAEVVGIETWAADVSRAAGGSLMFGKHKARTYRAIWAKFGTNQQQPEWVDAYSEIRGGTVGERMVEADFNRAITNASPEQKRTAFATLAREPEVIADLPTSTEVFAQIVRDNPSAVETAWKDTDTNVRLSTARVNAREEILEPIRRAQTESKEVFQPDDSTLEHTHFLYGVQSRVEQWAHELREVEAFLRRVNDVNVMTRRSTRRSLELLIDAANRCRDALPHSYDEPDTEPEAAVRAAQETLKRA